MEERTPLFNMDRHLIRLRSMLGEKDDAIVGLTGSYRNLLRMCVDT